MPRALGMGVSVTFPVPVVSRSEPPGKHFRNTQSQIQVTDVRDSKPWSGELESIFLTIMQCCSELENL